MISAVKFATRFTSFWLECLPKSHFFVQDANRSSKVFCPPIKGQSRPRQHAEINELGFHLFTRLVQNSSLLTNRKKLHAQIRQILKGLLPAQMEIPGIELTLGKTEQSEAAKLALNLLFFIHEYKRFAPVLVDADKGPTNQFEFERSRKLTPTILNPRFSGCGFIDASEGDIILGDTLYEIKSSDRTFRLVDFRQLLVYLTLNASSRVYHIRHVGLINPRTGDYIEHHIEDFARGLSGKYSHELFSEIIGFVSGGGVSR